MPQTKAQAEAGLAKRAEGERDEARSRLEQARQEAQLLRAAEERWRAGKAAAAAAAAALHRGLEAMP